MALCMLQMRLPALENGALMLRQQHIRSEERRVGKGCSSRSMATRYTEIEAH